MKPGTKALAILLICGGLHGGIASADYAYMGHCTDDATVSAEGIVAACTTFITKAFQENWQLQRVPVAMVYQASAYERLGQHERAEVELKSAVSKYPSFAPAWKSLGELLEKLKGPGMLMATMDAMLRANPDNASVLNEACWVRAEKGEQLDTAVADCTAALHLDPGNADYLDSRAFAHFRNRNFAQAIADTNAALAANPKLASSLYVRGLAKLKSADAAGGSADIAAAKAMDAKIADTYAGYGVTP